MKNALRRNYPGPGGMFAVSFICHLVVFLVIAYWHILPQFHEDETPVTYVDMVTLPVASPQSGTPAPSQQESKAPAAPAPAPPAPAAPAMALPSKPAAKTPAKAEQKEVTDAKAYNDRLNKLKQLAEDRRQADVLAALKKGSARTGMPGGKGTQAGSDYSSYLQSRLKDALRETMAMQGKAPQVMATITVSPDGHIDYHVEKPSGDPLFDDAVQRAVTLAGRTLVPPPNGAYFKRVFRFRPEGVGTK